MCVSKNNDCDKKVNKNGPRLLLPVRMFVWWNTRISWLTLASPALSVRLSSAPPSPGRPGCRHAATLRRRRSPRRKSSRGSARRCRRRRLERRRGRGDRGTRTCRPSSAPSWEKRHFGSYESKAETFCSLLEPHMVQKLTKAFACRGRGGWK